MNSLRVLCQNEDLAELIDKNKYDLITVISYSDLGLEKLGFKLKHKKLANIYLDTSLNEILNRFTRSTRQEIQQTHNISDLEFKIADTNFEDTYNLYNKFESAQGRKPWGRDSFDGVINFNAYYKGELIASVPCYDLKPYLQVRAIFSKRLDTNDPNLYKVIGKATRRLIFEVCKYGKERNYEFVGLGSVNYLTQQKTNVADFKMFFGPRLGDEYTYIYKSKRLNLLEHPLAGIKKIFAVLHRRYFEVPIMQKWVNSFIKDKTKNSVISGPFRGMKYIEESVGSRFAPKLLGTYELELASVIEKICRENFDLIIDVGAAEGYYAVGLAMRNLEAEVIAFESEKRGQDFIKEMSEKNDVSSRVLIRGFCAPQSLFEVIPADKKCLIIMDIEGGERELLDNIAILKLNNCHILVESHDCVVPGMGEIIKERFKNNKVTEIWQRDRFTKDFPIYLPWYLRIFKRYFVFNAMDEGRQDRLAGDQSKMRWFYIEPIGSL